MFDSLLGFLGNLPDSALWAVPIVGGVAGMLAFFAGRRFLGAGAKPPEGENALLPGSRLFEGVSRDRRASPRRKGHTVEVQISLEEDQPLHRAWVLNRSIGGVCILAEQAFAEGIVVRMRPRSSGESVPWTDVTIRSCRKDGAYFELGCQFHRTPNWNMLLQFG